MNHVWLDVDISDRVNHVLEALEERQQSFVIVLKLLPFATQKWYEQIHDLLRSESLAENLSKSRNTVN